MNKDVVYARNTESGCNIQIEKLNVQCIIKSISCNCSTFQITTQVATKLVNDMIPMSNWKWQEVYDWAGSMDCVPLHFTIQRRQTVVRHNDPLERHEILDLMERVSVFQLYVLFILFVSYKCFNCRNQKLEKSGFSIRVKTKTKKSSACLFPYSLEVNETITTRLPWSLPSWCLHCK